MNFINYNAPTEEIFKNEDILGDNKQITHYQKIEVRLFFLTATTIKKYKDTKKKYFQIPRRFY